MRTPSCIAAALAAIDLLAAPGVGRADDAAPAPSDFRGPEAAVPPNLPGAPETRPFERYLPLVQRAPFGPGSSSTVERSFAENYYLASTARLGEEHIAVLVDRMTNSRIYLSDRQPFQNFHLISVEQGESFKSTKVVIERDGERGVVTYDLSRLGAGASGNPDPLLGSGQHPGQPMTTQPAGQIQQPGQPPGAPPPPNRTQRRRLIVPKQP